MGRAQDNDGMTGFHIHVAEGMNDVHDNQKNCGRRHINRLLYNGIWGEKTMRCSVPMTAPPKLENAER